ncbi:MAG: 3-hydroxyacyl-CoA dehydrogenase NAD-binding domain-containing protein, partial [Planctomycetota bacterium]
MTDPATTVAVIGTGTMGAGIAQVAVAAGWTARLLDVDEATARRAVDGVRARLDRLVEKGRLAADERDAAAGRLAVASDAADLGDCGLVIEAVVEDLDVKAAVLGRVIAALPGDAIVATNTSSLSVTRIGEAVGAPERTVGMHFFNPAPLMKLVEIVAGTGTDPGVVARAAEIAAAWGKRVARAADVPGFIVNHVARPYYLE